jgi:hypothetical protein
VGTAVVLGACALYLVLFRRTVRHRAQLVEARASGEALR